MDSKRVPVETAETLLSKERSMSAIAITSSQKSFESFSVVY